MYVWAIDRLQQRTKLFRKNWLNFCDKFGGHDFLILRNRDVDKKEENKNKNCLVWPLVHKQRQQNIVNNNTRALLSRYQQTINMLTKKRQLIWYFIAVTEWAIISTPKAFFLSHRTAMVYDTDIEIGEYLFSFGWALELGIYIYIEPWMRTYYIMLSFVFTFCLHWAEHLNMNIPRLAPYHKLCIFIR